MDRKWAIYLTTLKIFVYEDLKLYREWHGYYYYMHMTLGELLVKNIILNQFFSKKYPLYYKEKADGLAFSSLEIASILPQITKFNREIIALKGGNYFDLKKREFFRSSLQITDYFLDILPDEINSAFTDYSRFYDIKEKK